MSEMAISALQCRAARALLDWSREQLAGMAQLDLAQVAEFEEGGAIPSGDVEKIHLALQKAGISFIENNQTSAAGGPGVRLLKCPEEFDTDQTQTVQYPEHLAADAPTGAGG